MELGGSDDGGAMELMFGDASVDTVPGDLRCAANVFDLAFHPTAPFLAIGLVSGGVDVHELRGAESRAVASLPRLHDGGVTGMEFVETGTHLVTISSDRTLNVLDCLTQQTSIRVAAGRGSGNPHKHGLSAVNICTETLVATADDDGLIALWDLRERHCVVKYHEHGDFVSQMLYFSQVGQLVSSSGDTCLGVFDVRSSKILDYSEKRKDELSCMAFVPETNGMICGTPSGSLPVWRFGSWRRPYDVFDNHPRECDCIATYNDNIVLTGACDGLVRILQVHPVKRNLCQLGGNTRRQGVNRLRISHDRRVLALSGEDATVQFVDIAFLASDQELDKLRSRAEQRHLATMREATREMVAAEAAEAAVAEGGRDDDSDWTSDGDGDAAVATKNDDDEDGEGSECDGDEAARRRRARHSKADSDDDEGGGGEDGGEAVPEKTERQRKRERAAAAKWLKEERRKKVNFHYERRRRRVGGFWGDLAGGNGS